MTPKKPQHGLGRGLASLISSNSKSHAEVQADAQSGTPSELTQKTLPNQHYGVYPKSEEVSDTEGEVGSRVLQIPIGSIVPNPDQPRFVFTEEKLTELADSIAEHGILQPLTVSDLGGGRYELIAGERRLQAAKRANLVTVPAIVKEVDNRKRLELAIIENVQRHDLSAIEEARSYDKLMKEYDLTQAEVAKKVGKSRSGIANTLRLLELPIETQRLVMEGQLSEGHAKVLLSVEDGERVRLLSQEAVRSHLSVRELERLVAAGSKQYMKTGPVVPLYHTEAERLAGALATKVSIQAKGKKGGKITIEFYSDEELAGILSKIQ